MSEILIFIYMYIQVNEVCKKIMIARGNKNTNERIKIMQIITLFTVLAQREKY